MYNDFELRMEGFKVLFKALGELNAERFIMLLNRDPFDYTEWRKKLHTTQTVEEIHKEAIQQRKSK
jgi:hypothetical protein